MESQIETLNRCTRSVQRNTRLMLISVLCLFVIFVVFCILQNIALSILLFACLMIDITAFVANGLRLERKGNRIISKGKFDER